MRKSTVFAIYAILLTATASHAGTVQNPHFKIKITARNGDDRIVVNNEFVGIM